MLRIGKLTHGVCIVSIVSLCVGIMLAGCAKQPTTTTEEPAAEPPPETSSAGVIVDARLRAGNDDLEGAAAMLEKLIEREEKNVEALRLLASVYSTMGKRDASTAVWERIAVLDPADADAAYQVGAMLARKKNWSKLRSKMLAAEASGAADSRHYLLIGEADMELGYRGEAEKYLKRAGELERACHLLGILYYEQGRLAESERAFSDAIRHNPDNYSAHLHLGWIHYNGGRTGQALDHYRSAIRSKPGEPLPRLSLAALLDEMERPREAIEQYRKALGLRGIPRDEKKKAYNSLSRLLVEGGRLHEAIEIIEEGLNAFPDSGGLYYQWGEALLKAGKPGEAREKFKRAAADPTWQEIALRRLHSIE
jgi:tetratricopeptide (TPR) repeat protein